MAKYTCIFEDPECVNKYDRLRYIPESVLLDVGKICYRLAVAAREGKELVYILDAGVGTGRFALSCARMIKKSKMDAQILGVDRSAKMLEQLQKNWENAGLNLKLKCIQTDIQEPLPIPKSSVHVIYTIATFHILDKWRKALDNLIQVLVPGGYLVFICENNQFMHQTEGFEKDCDFATIDPILRKFMKYYHELRQEIGEPYVPSELCYSDMMPAINYLREFNLEEIDSGISPDRLSWDKPHTYKDILHCFRNHQMTTWGSDLSDFSRHTIADNLDNWIEKHGIDIDKEFLLPACLIPYIFRKPGAKLI